MMTDDKPTVTGQTVDGNQKRRAAQRESEGARHTIDPADSDQQKNHAAIGLSTLYKQPKPESKPRGRVKGVHNKAKQSDEQYVLMHLLPQSV